MKENLSCDELTKDLAVLLLHAGAVAVFSPEEATRLITEHRSRRPVGASPSVIEEMATEIYARRSEYGLCGHLKSRSCNQVTQISAIRSAICLIADSVLRSEPSVEVGYVGVGEVLCGLDLTEFEMTYINA